MDIKLIPLEKLILDEKDSVTYVMKQQGTATLEG